MRVTLTDKETSILLGATLMYWGVPFHFSTKRELESGEQSALDQASDRLIALREEAIRQQSGEDLRQVELSPRELQLLIEVTATCLNECNGDAVELSLHLKTDSKQEVAKLLEQLRAAARES